MDLDKLVPAAISCGAVAVALYSVIRTRTRDDLKTALENAEKIAKLEVKVDALWDYQMHRAKTEALVKGTMTENSPLHVTPEARRVYDDAGLTRDLQAFYDRKGRGLSDSELFQEVFLQFGQRMVREACVPLGLHNGACILIAMEIAKEAPAKSLSSVQRLELQPKVS